MAFDFLLHLIQVSAQMSSQQNIFHITLSKTDPTIHLCPDFVLSTPFQNGGSLKSRDFVLCPAMSLGASDNAWHLLSSDEWDLFFQLYIVACRWT